MGQAGTYILVLYVGRKAEIKIGRLGDFNLASGYYLYAGSARGPGGLKARLRHHLRERKQLRWHIDYLLRAARVVEIWKVFSPRKLECLWAQTLLKMAGAKIPISGFGSSDCDCPTHLIYFASLPSFSTFASQLEDSGVEPCPVREMLGGPDHG
jgi:Uri superfamily endonuclease